jgi:hypothetical protein
VGTIPSKLGGSVSGMNKLLVPFDMCVNPKLSDATTAVVVFKGAKGTSVLSKWEGKVMSEEDLVAELQRLAKAYGNKAGNELAALVTPPRPSLQAPRAALPASRAAAPRASIRPAGESEAAHDLCQKYVEKKRSCPKCKTFPALKVYRNRATKEFYVKCEDYCLWYWSMKNACESELAALQAL